jgi:hypothetical protein
MSSYMRGTAILTAIQLTYPGGLKSFQADKGVVLIFPSNEILITVQENKGGFKEALLSNNNLKVKFVECRNFKEMDDYTVRVEAVGVLKRLGMEKKKLAIQKHPACLVIRDLDGTLTQNEISQIIEAFSKMRGLVCGAVVGLSYTRIFEGAQAQVEVITEDQVKDVQRLLRECDDVDSFLRNM